MRFEDTIIINASVERVWAHTIDIESCPATTPTISSIERLDRGPLRPGSTAKVKQPGQRAKVWTVTEVEPERRFVWRARLLGTEMIATHTLVPVAAGTANTLRIDIVGRGSGVVGRVIGGQIRKSLAKENAGLKRTAEAPTADAPGPAGASDQPRVHSVRSSP
jgi:hypothetical protein